jgi:hypothetical protein
MTRPVHGRGHVPAGALACTQVKVGQIVEPFSLWNQVGGGPGLVVHIIEMTDPPEPGKMAEFFGAQLEYARDKGRRPPTIPRSPSKYRRAILQLRNGRHQAVTLDDRSLRLILLKDIV